MKVIINSCDFKNAIAKVAPAVGKSTYFSALESIKISAANGMITATATNAEDFLNIDIHGRIIENGECYMKYDELKKMVFFQKTTEIVAFCEIFFTKYLKKHYLFLLRAFKLCLVPGERRLIDCGCSDGRPGVPAGEHITASIMQRAKNRLLTSSAGIMGMLQTLKRLRTKNPCAVGLSRASNSQVRKEQNFTNSFQLCWMRAFLL